MTEAPERLLHLFQGAAAIRFVGQSVFEKEPNVSMCNPDRGSELVCEHMQDVIYINSHASRERSTPHRDSCRNARLAPIHQGRRDAGERREGSGARGNVTRKHKPRAPPVDQLPRLELKARNGTTLEFSYAGAKARK
jgi:hypothetical protein